MKFTSFQFLLVYSHVMGSSLAFTHRFASQSYGSLRQEGIHTPSSSIAFTSSQNEHKPAFHRSQHVHPNTSKSSSTSLNMVFDFFKKRAEEGVAQLSNLSTKTLEGKLGEGLAEAASYTSETNAKFAEGLAKSRTKLLYDLEAVMNGGGDILEELEDILIQADLGIQTAEDVIEEVKSLREDSTKMISRDDLRSILRGKLIEILQTSGAVQGEDENENTAAIQFSDNPKVPTVLFVMGANGMGKTTTIGKLANRLRSEGGQKVLLAACDTFRAGAVEQLDMWAGRANVTCCGPTETQKSPSAVLYGALDKALAEDYDTVIVDTSGRLSNNDALTEELVKMKRVIQKRLSPSVMNPHETEDKSPNTSVPHDTLLVIDAAQGRMALESAKVWNERLGLSGLVVTKLDGSAKGGSVVAISRELNLPVKLIGVGESIDDLRDFEAEVFVDGLLGIGSAGGKSKNKNEGKLLEGRLNELRKARDERSKSIKQSSPTSTPNPSMNLSSMEADGSTATMTQPRTTFTKPKGKKKKGKKKKGRR